MDYIKVKSNSNTWSDVKTTYVKTDTGWKPVKLMYTKIDDTTWIPMIPGNAPTVFKVTPSSVPVINPPAVTTIFGSNFTQNMAVQIAYIPYGGSPIIKIISGSALTIIDKNKLTFATPTGNVSASGNICVVDNNGVTGNILPYSFAPNYEIIQAGGYYTIRSGFYKGNILVEGRYNKKTFTLDANGTVSFAFSTVTNKVMAAGLGNSASTKFFNVTFPDGTIKQVQINSSTPKSLLKGGK
jgi:hypothetical protein